MKLEDIVFNKRQPTKKGAIFRTLLTIGIILVVLIITVIITISKIASSITNENMDKVKTLLTKPYEESEIVTFSVGGVDEASFRTKLENNIVSFGELYTDNKINYINLFNDARLNSELELNRKDLTQLLKAWSNYELNSDLEKTLLEFVEIVNVELSTNDKTTSIRVCVKVDVSKLLNSINQAYSIQTLNDFPTHFYVTSFATINNKKPLESCILTSSLIVNNLSAEDNEFLLKYYAEMSKGELTLDELNKILTNYFLNSIDSILSKWGAVGQFGASSFIMQPN